MMKCMSFSEKIAIAINVLKDWKAIFILVLTLIMIALAKYVCNYTKKPPVPKPAKAAAAKEAPKKDDAKKDEAKADGGDEAAASEAK